MVEFYYIKCLHVTRKNRARNETLRGEVDGTSVTRNVSNRGMRWEPYRKNEEEKSPETMLHWSPSGGIEVTSL
jgi:hypothetical protein